MMPLIATNLTLTKLPPLMLLTQRILMYLQMCSPGTISFCAPYLVQLNCLTKVHLSIVFDTNISTVAGPQSPGWRTTSLTKQRAPPPKVKSKLGVNPLYTLSSSFNTFSTTL
jgi:hypothetical protein